MTLRLALDPGRATLRWWRDGAEQKPLVAVGRGPWREGSAAFAASQTEAPSLSVDPA
jgi:hypothetical protein